MKEQEQHPVIFITFGDIADVNSIEDLINTLKSKITKAFREYNYLNYSRKIESYFKEDFNEYISGNITKEALKDSLEFLSHLLTYTP